MSFSSVNPSLLRSVCFIYLFYHITSCSSPKIYGSYCGNKKSLVSLNLSLKEDNEFFLKQKLFHENWTYFKAGKYIIKDEKITLISYKGGFRKDSLAFLSKVDTMQGTIQRSKIILFSELALPSEQILRKRSQCNDHF